MTSLTEFLLARLGEDEAAARAVEPPGRPLEGGRYHSWHSSETGAIGNAAGQVVVYGSGLGDSEREHIARHDPARVLAQCAALRRIVEACGPVVAYESYEGPDYYGGTEACEEALRALASIYADHPDFDPTWRLT